ncbi:MAG: response regulator [Thalassotalea sp.]|nr:response regulator [Thalassotalea sp.]
MNAQTNLTRESGIVIIDDELSMAELACDILRELGFNNIVAYTSLKNLTEETKIAEAQLIFIDINLKETSGLVLLAWFKNKYPDKRVVMFSGDTRKDLVSEAKNLGACSFLSKVELHKNMRQLFTKWKIPILSRCNNIKEQPPTETNP